MSETKDSFGTKFVSLLFHLEPGVSGLRNFYKKSYRHKVIHLKNRI